MRYKYNDKNINIPDEFIEKNMANLGISRQECVDMYLSDEGFITNDEIVAMSEKAKTAGAGAKATGEKTKRKAPVRQPDEMKRALIDILAVYLGATSDIENLEVTNVERMIAFEVKGEKYEITLTKKRKPKE